MKYCTDGHGLLRKQEVRDLSCAGSCYLIQWVQIDSLIHFSAGSTSDLLKEVQFQLSSCVI